MIIYKSFLTIDEFNYMKKIKKLFDYLFNDFLILDE